MEVRKSSSGKLCAFALAIAIAILATMLSAALPAKAFATQSKSGNFYSASLSGNGASDMVAVAQAQNGRSQSSMGYTEGWCADFVSDCAKIAGQSDAIPFNGGVSNLYNAIINAGGTVVSSPQKGDIAFFGNYAHVGIMVDSTYCISGNMDSSYVRTYRYSAMSPSIKCFVRPNYKAATKKSGGATVYPSGNYTIVSAVGGYGGYVLDIAACGDSNGTVAQIWEPLDQTGQIFNVVGNGAGISPLCSGRWLDTDGNPSNGISGKVQLWDGNGCAGQQWFFEDAGDGCVYIRNTGYGYLDVVNGTAANGTAVQTHEFNGSNAQKWKLAPHSGVTKKTDVEAGCYTLKSAAGNVVLDIAGGAKGGNAQVYQPVNNTNMLFDVHKNTSGGGYAFQCVTVGVNWLGTYGNTCGAGANVLDQAGDGSYGQNWFIEDAGGGYVYIRNKWGYYLDVYCGGTSDGTNVRVWDFNGSNAQKWKLVKSSGKGAAAVASDSYLIRSAADSSLALSAAGEGTANDENIQLASAQSIATQVFAVGNKTDLAINEANVNYHYLDLAATGKRIVGYTNANGPTNAILFDGTSENNNCWAFEDAGDGNYYIRDRWGYYLTASSVKAGGNVETASFTGESSQKWQLDAGVDWKAYAKAIAAASSVDYACSVYKRFDTNVGWDEAKAICEALGGHLVTIADANEQAAVQGLVSGAYNIYAIGCTDAEEEGTWKWVTGEKLSYTNWDLQLPEPNGGTESNCGFMVAVDYGTNKQAGEWIDSPEHTDNMTFYTVAGAGFVCEYEVNHSYTKTVTAPTCTKKGYTTHTCKKCGYSYTDTKTAALGHDWGEWVVTKEPTRTADGERTHTCKRCGAAETEAVPRIADLAVEQLAGSTRYETAAGIVAAELEGGKSYPGVIVASGAGYADALAASGLAGVLGYPILLTDPAALQGETASALGSLVSANGGKLDVVVVGGTAAVSDAVASALAAYDSDGSAWRISGADRYATNRAVYDYGASHGGWSDGTAVVATGANYADALAISPYACASKSPVVLVSGGSLTDGQREMVASCGSAVVLGGTAAVSEGAYADAEAAAGSAERLSGSTRYQTGAAIASWEIARGMSMDGCGVATGANFPDALASGFLLGSRGSVLVLVDPTGASNGDACALASANGASVGSVTYLGGTGAVPQAVRDAFQAALG